MKHSFIAKIYKTGINGCVDVPKEISEQLIINKGRINIKGKINGFDFSKTLMPVKNGCHRLFVNRMMMQGGKTALGQMATFIIEQNTALEISVYPTPQLLVQQLVKNNLTADFDQLIASRKKEILKYLSYLKSEETLLKNINKLIVQLKNKEKNVRIP